MSNELKGFLEILGLAASAASVLSGFVYLFLSRNLRSHPQAFLPSSKSTKTAQYEKVAQPFLPGPGSAKNEQGASPQKERQVDREKSHTASPF